MGAPIGQRPMAVPSASPDASAVLLGSAGPVAPRMLSAGMGGDVRAPKAKARSKRTTAKAKPR
jgi:hypothetical protein